VHGATTQFALTLAEGSTTTFSNVFLAPTISGNKTSLSTEENITLSGVTIPNATVNLTVNSDPVLFTTTSDANGNWSQIVQGLLLPAGTHTAQAQATSPSSLVSEQSSIITFTVTTPTIEPTQCTGKLDADINCDGFVDLIDFSIMLYYWNQTNPANDRADINNDTLVNEADFSILLFFWTG
jgi:hypothetical protein